MTGLLKSTVGSSGVAALCGTVACLTAVYLGGEYLVKSSNQAGMVLCQTVPGGNERCVEVTHQKFLDDYGFIKSGDAKRDADLAWAARQRRWSDKMLQASILTIFPFSVAPGAARLYWRGDTQRATDLLNQYRPHHDTLAQPPQAP